jgi:mycofactocin system glycosyltransferase
MGTLMQVRPPLLRPGCYRLARIVRIIPQQNGGLALCSYPLHVLRLSTLATSLLLQCCEQQTCEQLAHNLEIPIKRVQAICEQLRWKGLLDAGPALPPATWPSISIIIPTHNRAQQLERCLISLLNLDYPTQCLELIIVDDASADDTTTILEQLSQQAIDQGVTTQVIRHKHRRGVARSRNAGAAAAHHELLAFIDSDCVASPSWLANLVPAFQDVNLAAVGGMIRAYEPHSMLGRYEDSCSSLFMGTRPQQVRLEGPLTYLPTANLLVRRVLWHKLGGFAPFTFGEDVDFCHRLLASGSAIIYLPQGIVYHDYRTTLLDFLRTRISYGSSEAALLQRRSISHRTLFLPPEQALFAGSLVGGMWLVTANLESRRGRFLSPCIFFLIGLLHTFFGTFIRRQKVRQQNIPLNPFVIFMATLRGHLAYTYHLCRHLTRYYALPLLLIGLLIPPILLFLFTLYSIVIGLDYVRLHPHMSLPEYILCSLLDDCAYEIGVVLGCIKHGTWKPLLPVINIQRKNTPK